MRRLALVGVAALAAVVAIGTSTPRAQTEDPRQQPQQPQQPTFRGGTRIVPVWATVRDPTGAFDLDLTKDDFEIRDNGKVQTITQFTREAQPLSVVVVIDGSSSMMPIFNAVLDGVNQFVIRLMPGDEGRIESFADQTRMSPEFTSNRDALLDYLRDQFNIRMANETRLWDALSDAMQAVGERQGRRRVVVVFTDGDDTNSSSSEGHVASMAGDRDAIVYALAMWTKVDGRGGTRPSRRIEELATQTGGGFYELHETDDMNSTFTSIAEELHNQYVLGFQPATLDGKEHKLEVKVKRDNVKVRARKTYVASADTINGRGAPPPAGAGSRR
jgi:Ca-activated chloride channel family protein